MVKELIPRPKSVFLKIKCLKCGNEQIVFERSSLEVRCNVCNETLLETSGGKGIIKGEIIQTLE